MATATSVQRIIFANPDDGETPQQIAEHNLRAADSILDLPLMLVAMQGFFAAEMGSTNQDFEDWLRSHHLQTHCFASRLPVDSKATVLTPRGTDGPCSYLLNLSCRPVHLARQEILSIWPSMQTNYAALLEAGTLGYTSVETFKEDAADNKDIVPIDPANIDTNTLIQQNKLKIVLETVPLDVFVRDHIATIEKEQNIKTHETVVSRHAGQSVSMFFHQGKRVTELAVTRNTTTNQILRIHLVK
jgi:hypothetical protein